MSIKLAHDVGRLGLLSFFALAAVVPLSAQCQFAWQPGSAAPSPLGNVRAVLPTVGGDLYVGGNLAAAGSTLLGNIGRYDGSQWHALGAGIDGAVEALVQLPNGDIVACGTFGSAGNAAANNIARWTGSEWFPLGAGCDGLVRDMIVLPNGSIVAVGNFTAAGGVSAAGVALWNGSSWAALGSGPLISDVASVTRLANGNLVVGGFATPGNPDVQIWDGTAWSSLPGVAPSQLSLVDGVHALPGGEVVIDGFLFNPNGTVSNLAIWDGTQLLPLAPPFTAVHELATAPNGDLLVVGQDGASNTPPVARYDGTTWTLIGNSLEAGFNSLAVAPGGSLYVAREIPITAGNPLGSIAQLQFATWVRLPSAVPVTGRVLANAADGGVYAGGAFDSVEGVAASNIAHRGPNGWTALGQGVDGSVEQLAVAPDGSVIVGGSFLAAGGTPANRVARWNGSSWSTLGAGLASLPRALGVNQAGLVVAVAGNEVQLFDGQAWSVVGSLLGTARDVVALPNGDFLLAGSFIVLGPAPPLQGMLRVSNGAASFEPAFSGSFVNSMIPDGSGGVYVSRVTNGVQTIDQYDGANLTQVASASNFDQVLHLQVAPGGDLLGITGMGSSLSISRWDGAAWTVIPGSPASGVADMVISDRGEIQLAGSFFEVGGVVSSGLAHAASTCPAEVATFGAGCIGSAGAVELEAVDRPWLGTTMQQVATGMAPGSLALHLVGTATGVMPLPLGAPGCSLIVAPVFSDALVPQGGEVVAPLTIPALTGLVGMDLFSQVVGLELGPGLTLLQTTGSNALRLKVGVF